MPALTKQTLINLLIDSPLREPIKINLIDIVNNTNDVDLPKTYSTISKELEIFQKATERRMKLADETIAKLKEDGSTANESTPAPSVQTDSSLPPLPPLPTPETPAATPLATPPMPAMPTPPASADSLAVPPLDLPPLPTPPTLTAEPAQAPPAPTVEPAAPPVTPAPVANADEDALKEIQKELDALKSSATDEVAPAPTTPQA